MSVSLPVTTEPIETPFGLWTWVGPRKHVLEGMHIGATWQMRPYVKLLYHLFSLPVSCLFVP